MPSKAQDIRELAFNFMRKQYWRVYTYMVKKWERHICAHIQSKHIILSFLAGEGIGRTPSHFFSTTRERGTSNQSAWYFISQNLLQLGSTKRNMGWPGQHQTQGTYFQQAGGWKVELALSFHQSLHFPLTFNILHVVLFLRILDRFLIFFS